MSSRQEIVDSLETQLATISVANGYLSNFGGRVFIWRDFATVDPTEIPCLLVSDTDLDREQGPMDAIAGLLCEITAVAKGSTSAIEARAMEQDVFKCLSAWVEAHSDGVLLQTVNVKKSSIMVEQHDTKVGACRVICRIQHDDNFPLI